MMLTPHHCWKNIRVVEMKRGRRIERLSRERQEKPEEEEALDLAKLSCRTVSSFLKEYECVK